MSIMLARIGAYIWWEISVPKRSEPSKSSIRLAGILGSGCRNIFREASSQNTKSSHGRKT